MELSQDLSARHDLVDQYRPFVLRVVGHLIRALKLPADRHEEFVAAGYLGLVEAASRFDFDAGTSFKSYAYLRIRGAIIDSIRSSADLSGRAYQHARVLHAAHELREEIAAEPESPARTAAADRLARILDFAAKASLTYRLTIHDAEVEISTRGEYPVDPEAIIESSEMTRKIREFVETLPEKERNVIKEYYFLGLSFSRIGEVYGGRSKSWVCRLHKRALALLHEQVVAYHAGLPPPPPSSDSSDARADPPRMRARPPRPRS